MIKQKQDGDIIITFVATKKKKKKRVGLSYKGVPILKKSCTYVDFLKSKYWHVIRLKVLKRDKYTCQHCSKKVKLHVHHKTYKHHLEEHKYMNDLISLCERCHDNAHIKNEIK